jgi:serine/threonine protein kinase
MSEGAGRRPERVVFDEGKMIDRFRIQKHIGAGGYGDIYSAIDTKGSSPCAVKIEYLDAEKKGLSDETRIILKLNGSIFFPKFIGDGVYENFRYLVIDLFGPSLSSMRRALPRHRFSSYSYLRLSEEMLNCIEEFHEKGFIHRDIKPGNFLIKPDRVHPVCLIDFGLSQSYLSARTGRHVAPSKDAGFTGTCRYASLHAHEEKQLSRRDDLISWFYSTIELAHGRVPWPGSRDRVMTVKLKKELSISILCEGFPSPFEDIWKHLRGMKFRERPNYSFIRKSIRKSIKDLGFREPPRFDWEGMSTEEMSEISSVPLTMGSGERNDSLFDGPSSSDGGCIPCLVS